MIVANARIVVRAPSASAGFSEEEGACSAQPIPGMRTYHIEVGYEHGVKPGNIVGAIANEADLDSKQIGRIDIYDDHNPRSAQEPAAEKLELLKTVRVAQPGAQDQPRQRRRIDCIDCTGRSAAQSRAPQSHAGETLLTASCFL